MCYVFCWYIVVGSWLSAACFFTSPLHIYTNLAVRVSWQFKSKFLPMLSGLVTFSSSYLFIYFDFIFLSLSSCCLLLLYVLYLYIALKFSEWLVEIKCYYKHPQKHTPAPCLFLCTYTFEQPEHNSWPRAQHLNNHPSIGM